MFGPAGLLITALAALGVACGGGGGRTSGEPVNDLAAAWSPDGRSLVFDHPHDGDTEIYVQDSDGIEQLTDNDRSDYYPSWSPDGRRIAFLSDREDGRQQLYVMNSDGADEERLSDVDDGVAGPPAWLPDSDRLAYTELDCEAEVCTGTIRVVELATKQTTTIARRREYDMRDPAFARDGRLAFAVLIGSPGIRVASADGRQRRTVVGDPGSGWPAWSPDGGTIAYQCGYAICLVGADGAGDRILRTAPAERPAWSPDGRRIVYACGKPPEAPSSSKAGSLCTVSVGDGTSRSVQLQWPK